MKGLLIAIEGINGCGKSTLITQLVNVLTSMDRKVKLYKFPDRSGKCGKQIDDYLNNKSPFEYKYDMLDAFAVNTLSVRKNIKKDVKEGYIVICDRYYFSGIVYNIPLDVNENMLKIYSNILGHFYTKMPNPDITYLINGQFLSLRNETAQRYHYNNGRAIKLFDMYKDVLKMYTNYIILNNEYNKMDNLVNYVVSNINTFVCR